MVLIFGSFILVSKDNPFPGFAAIPPTLGTAAVILSGGAGTTWATNFLTLRGMLWIGTISYSAYLWHWPILAFLRYGNVEISFVVGGIELAILEISS
jgi:peptidoglycan/LPS O-acetylase OafA/YrhL